jgi:uncharacterized membrane protein YgdD (TMEM256/DUF423 family)
MVIDAVISLAQPFLVVGVVMFLGSLVWLVVSHKSRDLD